MAITSKQQTEILKVVAGLFNAAPGGVYLTAMADFVQAGNSAAQLSDSLASSPVFINSMMAGKVTTEAQAAVLMKNFGLVADSTATSAGSLALKYFTDSINAKVGLGKIVFDAVTYLSGTPAAEFKTAATLLENKALVSAAYSAEHSSSDLSVLQNVLSAVTGTAAYTSTDVAAILAGSGASAGTSFTLTSNLDVINGSSNADTIIGDFANSIGAGDQINGGGGSDVFKMFGTYDAAKMPISITNTEVIELAVAADASIDFTNWAKATTGVEKFMIDNAAAMSGKTITTTAGQALSLATGASNVGTAGTVTWVADIADTSASLTLNGYQGATIATPAALTIIGAKITTQNIASTGNNNKVTTLTLGALTDKVVVTGDKKLTVSTDLVSSGGATILKTVDASAATGGVNVTLAATSNAAFAFTGGSGDDSIKFADDGVGALTAGTQLDGGAGTADKIGLLDTVISAVEYTKLNAAKNFEVLGLNAGVSVDGSQLTSIKKYSLDTSAIQSVINMATGGDVAITAAHAANVTLGGAVGVNDVKLSIGTATTAGLTVGGNLTIGQTSVALSSNGTSGNTINALLNADNSVYTITGAADLTITSMQATTTGTKVDASAFTGKLTVTGNATAYSAGSGLGDILIGGSGADTIKASVNSSKLTGNGGADTFNVEAAPTAATTSVVITTITDFTKGDKIDFGVTAGAFTAAKIDISAAATEAAAIDLLVAGSNTDLKWGVYNGNTYIADDVGVGATVAATDTVVKLTGALDLSTSTLSATVLTFA